MLLIKNCILKYIFQNKTFKLLRYSMIFESRKWHLTGGTKISPLEKAKLIVIEFKIGGQEKINELKST